MKGKIKTQFTDASTSSWEPKNPADKLPPGLALPSSLFVRYRQSDQIARMPFIINNAVDYEKAYRDLREKHVNPDRDVFIGISGLRCLDLLCNIGRGREGSPGQRYNKAVLFDSNITQPKAMNSTLVLIQEFTDAQDFIDGFIPHYLKWVSEMPRWEFGMKDSAQSSQTKSFKKKSHLPPSQLGRRSNEDVMYFGVTGANYPPRDEAKIREYLEKQMQNPNSWLHKDNYPYIKQLIEQRQIETIVTDLDDRDRFRSLSSWLLSNNLRAGDLYLSSTIGFLAPEFHFDYWGRLNNKDMRESIINNIRLITDEHTNLLNSHASGVALDPNKPSETLPFELRIENRDCDRLQALSGPAVDFRKQTYHYSFGVGHATCTLNTPTPKDWQVAQRNPALKVLDQFDWRGTFKPFSLELTCPDYISDGTTIPFIQRSMQQISKVIRVDYSMQDLHVAHGDRSLKVIFLIPYQNIQNPSFFTKLAGSISTSLMQGEQPGKPDTPMRHLLGLCSFH